MMLMLRKLKFLYDDEHVDIKFSRFYCKQFIASLQKKTSGLCLLIKIVCLPVPIFRCSLSNTPFNIMFFK